MTASLPLSSATTVTVPPPGLLASPCRTAFSTSGCSAKNGTTTGSTSGAIRSCTFNRSGPNLARSRVR